MAPFSWSSSSPPTTTTKASLGQALRIHNYDTIMGDADTPLPRRDYHCLLQNATDCQNLVDFFQHHQQHDNHHNDKVAVAVHLTMDGTTASSSSPVAATLMDCISQLPRLQEVSIQSSSKLRKVVWDASVLSKFIKQASQLQTLKLTNVQVHGGSVYDLAEALQDHVHLTKVEVCRCSCRPVEVLLQAFGRMSRLEEIVLDGTILEQQQGPEALKALQQLAVGGAQRLTLVDIPEVGATQQLLAILGALATAKGKDGVKELALHVVTHDSLPRIVIDAMAKMLRTNTSLEILTVTWMGGGEILLPIIQALAVNQTLREFKLAPGFYSVKSPIQVCFSQPFLDATALALSQNYTLTHLWFDNDNATWGNASSSWQPVSVQIDLILRANALGRHHLIHDTHHARPECRPSHHEWIAALCASHEHAHVSYYWLSNNPSILNAAVSTLSS